MAFIIITIGLCILLSPWTLCIVPTIIFIIYPFYIIIALQFSTIIGFIKFITFKETNLKTSIARVINSQNNNIILLFPYFQDKYLTIIDFYIHSTNIKVPSDIRNLIWQFHGYNNQKQTHYITNCTSPNLSASNPLYVEILHIGVNNNGIQRYAVPTAIFGDNVDKNIFILLIFIHETMKMFVRYEADSSWINLISYLDIWAFILRKYRHGIVLQSQCITEIVDSTYNIIHESSNTNYMKPVSRLAYLRPYPTNWVKTQTVIELSQKATYIGGDAGKCQIVFDNIGASDVHALINLEISENSSYAMLENLSYLHDIYVNGQSIGYNIEKKLQDGDLIEFIRWRKGLRFKFRI